MRKHEDESVLKRFGKRGVLLFVSGFFLVTVAFGLAIRFLSQYYFLLAILVIWIVYLMAMYRIVRGFEASERFKNGLLLYVACGGIVSTAIPFVSSLGAWILIALIVSAVLVLTAYVGGYID